MKKYELTNNAKYFCGTTLYQIKALRDFGNVKKGDLGGFIEKEDNLSHNGECWVYDSALVFGNASVLGNAKVYGNARVFGNAKVYENAMVSGNIASGIDYIVITIPIPNSEQQCDHEWVNVGFTTETIVCKYCDKEKK